MSEINSYPCALQSWKIGCLHSEQLELKEQKLAKFFSHIVKISSRKKKISYDIQDAMDLLIAIKSRNVPIQCTATKILATTPLLIAEKLRIYTADRFMSFWTTDVEEATQQVGDYLSRMNFNC